MYHYAKFNAVVPPSPRYL